MDLLVIVPVRGRRANAERLLKSFAETTDNADLMFISDGDDQDTYRGMDWGDAFHAVLDPRTSVVRKLNYAAGACEGYGAYMSVGDDNVFVTPHWDAVMLDALADLGGSGWVYPDDRRRSDVPENWLASADVIETLGWFAPPEVDMYYPDNIIAELGKRSGLIRYCPAAVVEHRHYTICSETARDQVYIEAENTWGASDLAAYQRWRADVMPLQVSLLRREFNPDVEWVLSRIGELCGTDHGSGDSSVRDDGNCAVHDSREPVQRHFL